MHLNDGGHADGEYVHINVLAEWVVRQVAAGDLQCLPELFAEVEPLLAGASHEVRNLLTTGLVEDIQLFAMRKLDWAPAFDADIVLGLLGPESRKAWFDWIARYWDRFEPGSWRWQHAETGA
jgi:hypothetical protein